MNYKCIKIFIALLVFVMPVSLYAQNAFKVTGRVYDAQTKEPIIGAGVMMKASNIGTITDLDGNYEMTVNDAKGMGMIYLLATSLSLSPYKNTKISENVELL